MSGFRIYTHEKSFLCDSFKWHIVPSRLTAFSYCYLKQIFYSMVLGRACNDRYSQVLACFVYILEALSVVGFLITQPQLYLGEKYKTLKIFI